MRLLSVGRLVAYHRLRRRFAPAWPVSGLAALYSGALTFAAGHALAAGEANAGAAGADKFYPAYCSGLADDQKKSE